MSNLVRLKKLYKIKNNIKIPKYKNIIFVMHLQCKNITFSLCNVNVNYLPTDKEIVVNSIVTVSYCSMLITEKEATEAIDQFKKWLNK